MTLDWLGIGFLHLSGACRTLASLVTILCHRERKKAGVTDHPGVFDHAGLLVNGPPGMAGLPFT
jgi:hypothetical protein